MQYRGFAAARGTKQNGPLFCLYLQGQRVDDLPPMVLLAYGSKLDHAHGGRPARFCQRAPTKSGSSVTAIKMTHSAEIRLGAPLAIHVKIRTGRVSKPGG